MRTFAQVQSYIESIYNDTSQSTLVQGLINDYHKEVLSETNWPSSRSSTTATSVAQQQGYSLPVDYNRMIAFKATIGGVAYYPPILTNEYEWNRLNEGTGTIYNDIPQYSFLKGDKFYLFPTPSSSSVTYTLEYDTRVRDLASGDFTDYTTGTVSITNAATTVTGSGTTFAATMVNRFIRADTDGFWYRISAYASATSITISKALKGSSVSGSTFRIGTLPFAVGGDNIIPEEGWKVIAYGVLMELFEKREDMSAQGGRAKYFENKYNMALQKLMKLRKNLFSSPFVAVTGLRSREDPNLSPTGLTT